MQLVDCFNVYIYKLLFYLEYKNVEYNKNILELKCKIIVCVYICVYRTYIHKYLFITLINQSLLNKKIVVKYVNIFVKN